MAKGLVKFTIILILGLVLVYFQSSHFAFNQLDDYDQIVNNTNIKSLDWNHIKSTFQSKSVGMYQPFTTLLYTLIHSFFGLNPLAYHISSLIFHLINCLLLFRLLQHFGIERKLTFLFVAIFAFHPMQVESIVWASAFSNLVFCSFFFASMVFYIYYFKTKLKKYYLISLFLFIVSCLSKSTAVVLPLFLMACDYFFSERVKLSMLLNKVPFFILSLIFGIITLYSRESAGHLSDLSISFNLFDRMFLIAYSILFYPFKFIFPVKLSVFYPYPDLVNSMLPFYFYLSLVILGALLFLLWKNRKEKILIVGTAFFLFGVAPIIQLIPVGNQITTDRYVYLPIIGFTLILAHCIKRLRLKVRAPFQLVYIIPILLTILSYNRSKIWENDRTIWENVLTQYPNVAQAHNNLGSHFMDYDPSKALEHFNAAVQLKPYYADAYANRGTVLASQGRQSEALDNFSKALNLRPHANAYFNRANEYLKIGDYKLAIHDYTQSILLKPGVDAYTNRAYVYLQIKEIKAAQNDIDKALKINPNYHQAYYTLGMSYHMQQNINKACEAFRSAIQLGNSNAQHAYNRICR